MDSLVEQRPAARAGAQQFSDAASARQDLWEALREVFRRETPNEATLARVSTLSEVAIDRVFSAYSLNADTCEQLHGQVKDYAECGTLYGYVLGYNDARADLARLATSGD